MHDQPPERILFVDDDLRLLQGMRRQFRREFQLSVAEGGQKALELIRNQGPFAVVVSDRSMPEMNGIELLNEIRTLSPETVRIMLTGDAHLQAAMDAVNEGQIFRFLTKPCDREVMRKTLEAAIEQHRLITSKKVLLSQTLKGSVKVLIDVLSLVGTEEFADAARLKTLVNLMVKKLDARPAWEVEVAATLSTIGMVAVPATILRKVQQYETLTREERDIFERHARIGYDLISNIPRLENVAKIVLYQRKNYDGTGLPENRIAGKDIPLGSRIIRAVMDYNAMTARRCTPGGAIARLQKSPIYDPAVIEALGEIVTPQSGGQNSLRIRNVNFSQLKQGMITASEICTVEGGTLLVRRGQEITEVLLQRLRNYHRQTPVCEVVSVLVSESEAWQNC